MTIEEEGVGGAYEDAANLSVRLAIFGRTVHDPVNLKEDDNSRPTNLRFFWPFGSFFFSAGF